MKNSATKPAPTATLDAVSAPVVSAPLGARIGRIVAVTESGIAHIDFPGNPHGAMAAKLALSSADADRLWRAWKDTDVLIVFANQDLRQPVITGMVRNSLDDPLYQISNWEGFRQLTLRAQEELTIECGDSRIVLRRDGKVTIVGKEILSRALERHRIRGASVDIN
jgi:hypothetical protein